MWNDTNGLNRAMCWVGSQHVLEVIGYNIGVVDCWGSS